MATTDPASLPLRTPLWRVLAASGARFAEINGGAVADRYGDGSDEIKRFQRLGIADLTPLPRTGFKGAGAIDWLRSQGLFVPSTRNRTTGQLGGALVARLSDTEVLVLSDIAGESDLVGKVDAAWPVGSGPRGWPLPRFDSHAWFWVGGTHAAAMFAKLCAVDLRPCAFAGDAVAQTSVARTTAIVIRADLGGILAYNLLCDRASAEYLWPVLLDAAEEFGGGPVGHAALVAQVR